MNKQDLKSLLENIYYLLVEEAPPPPEAKAGVAGSVQPRYAPGMSPQERISVYDPYAQPSLPKVGPWNGQWGPNWVAVWPPPTSALPPAGPGGMWMMGPVPNGLQQGYELYYVYPQNTVNGLFPAWHWGEINGQCCGFIEVIPSWGDPS